MSWDVNLKSLDACQNMHLTVGALSFEDPQNVIFGFGYFPCTVAIMKVHYYDLPTKATRSQMPLSQLILEESWMKIFIL